MHKIEIVILKIYINMLMKHRNSCATSPDAPRLCPVQLDTAFQKHLSKFISIFFSSIGYVSEVCVHENRAVFFY